MTETHGPPDLQGSFHYVEPGEGSQLTRCVCGKYQGERYSGIVCERCGFEITLQGYLQPRYVVELSWGALRELLDLLSDWETDGRRTTSRARARRFARPLVNLLIESRRSSP